jgi:hypothetical protein
MKRIGVMLAALCCFALSGTLLGKKTTSNDRSTVVRPKPPKPPKRPKVHRDSKGRIVQSSWRKPKKCASTGVVGPCPGMPVEPAMPKPIKSAKAQRVKTPPQQARPIQPAQPSQQQPSPPAATGSEAKDPAQ